jgi:hypothetical protein
VSVATACGQGGQGIVVRLSVRGRDFFLHIVIPGFTEPRPVNAGTVV